VTINRRQFLRDFDLMTCIAAALGIVFLAVLVEAGLRQDFQRQERVNDANDSKAVDRDGAEEGDRPLASRRQGQDANGGPAGGGAAGQLQPCAGDAAVARRGPDSRRLFDAIRQVESGGNDRAVGDGGRSVGPYQCSRAAWLDGGGKAADYPRLAYDRAETERVILGYWKRYGATTDEVRARIWNGGPAGMKKAATLPYWNKVKKELAK